MVGVFDMAGMSERLERSVVGRDEKNRRRPLGGLSTCPTTGGIDEDGGTASHGLDRWVDAQAR